MEPDNKRAFWGGTAFTLLIAIPLLLLGRYMKNKIAEYEIRDVKVVHIDPWPSKVTALISAHLAFYPTWIPKQKESYVTVPFEN
ncbi:MAG: hypothetical protein ACHQHN_17920 [Sphingobacteriales bacterium]